MSEESSDDRDPFEWVESDTAGDEASADDSDSRTSATDESADSDGDSADSADNDGAAADSTDSDDTTGDSADQPDVTVTLGDVPSEPLGGWESVPDEPPGAPDESEAESTATEGDPESDGSVAVPAPPSEWRERDPTEARWWWILTRTTQLSLVVLLAWSVPLAAFDLTEQLALESLSTSVSVAILGLSVVALLVRFVVLPIALFRDATLLRRDERVAWSPSLVFYGVAGGIFATGTCLYYLFKRGRYVGNPSVGVGDALLRYEGQAVASSWWAVIGVAAGVGTLAGGASTAISELPLPTKLVRIVVGGPLLSVDGASSVVQSFGSLPSPVDIAVGAPVLAVGGTTVFLRLVVLPLAFYNDATAVRQSDAPWDPLALWYALAGWILAVPTATVYLYRRLRYTDVSLTGR